MIDILRKIGYGLVGWLVMLTVIFIGALISSSLMYLFHGEFNLLDQFGTLFVIMPIVMFWIITFRDYMNLLDK